MMLFNIRWIGVLLILLVVSMPFCFAVEMNLFYDANGNLVSGDGLYRVYNSLNQLSKVYNGSTPTLLLEEYVYHPVEERVLVKKLYNSSGSVVETTYYITQEYVQVINTSGTFNFTYYRLQGQLVAQDVNGVKTYLHTDNKGNVVAITNSTGKLIENTSYSPTGEILTGGNKSRYNYEGKEQDKITRQTDFHFRMYQSSTNQFTQPDTIIQNVYDPQSLNRFAFERNSPYNHIDPTGHVLPLGVVALVFVIGMYYAFNERDAVLAEQKQARESGDQEKIDEANAHALFFMATLPLTFLNNQKGLINSKSSREAIDFLDNANTLKSVVQDIFRSNIEISNDVNSAAKVLYKGKDGEGREFAIVKPATDKNGKTATDRLIEQNKQANREKESQGLKFKGYDSNGKAVWK